MDLRIKDVMQEKGITGRNLAERLDKTPQYVSNFVSGRQNMSLNALERLADILGVPVWQFFVSPDDVKTPRLYSYIHINGKDESPDNIKDMLSALCRFNEAEYRWQCHADEFEFLKKHFAADASVLTMIEELDKAFCRMIAERFGVECLEQCRNKR